MIHYIVGRNLGHLSRCVANVKKFNQISDQKVKVFAFKHSHSWLRSNLPKAKIRSFSKEKLKDKTKNFLKAKLIMHDWRKEVEWLKKERGKKGPVIGGIYHSEMFTTREDSDWTTKFKHEIHDVSEKTTDIFFHMNLLPPYRTPKLSTFYVPIPIISRKVSMSPQKVRKVLGLKSSEPFILIHMGGGVGPFRYKYMDEWYDRLMKVRTPYRMVVANQFGGVRRKFPKSVIQAPLFPNGPDLINAAELVISKPGMGIMIDCITTGTPLLSLPADSKEREVKNMMLQDLTNNPLCIASKKTSVHHLSRQIRSLLDQSQLIKQSFQQVPCNGAEVVAKCMKKLSRISLEDLPDAYPEILRLSPFDMQHTKR
ncbi:hypothetical protein [Ammoniphilus sp. CFH 90114]|uniref:hypothetical protein n=1 Tax=Ammoniphilus sp. CFH 90114 TaxID=2493665 RepID=UPI00100DE97D|nr:hypothetical protein [Ammoniphilus sp. CFH 90114]RXT13956.1 hypothetical protein EIZ39_07430 [Ammoniphilus sp. CFH 90114]